MAAAERRIDRDQALPDASFFALPAARQGIAVAAIQVRCRPSSDAAADETNLIAKDSDMAQHDNGRRPVGQQAGAWQQGQRDPQDYSSNQQDQPQGGRYGAQQGGGQRDFGGSHGQQDQYGQGRGQQGDNWRDHQSSSFGGSRPAMEERDRGWDAGRGGQGSLGGQASDNDYGNRGITESGNFGNYGSQRDRGNHGAPTGQGRYGQGSDYDPGGQSGQRFGGYRHGYDPRSDSTGGYGSGHFGSENTFGSGNYGGGAWNAGSYGSRASRDYAGGRGYDSAYGPSSADNYLRGRGAQGLTDPDPDRYGDNGYQGNWQPGQRGQAYHDPDYHQWRNEQLSRLDRDYDEWRQHRYQRFSEDFDNWRANRDDNPAARASSQVGADASGTSASAGSQQAGAIDTSGQQGGTSRHDVSSGGDRGAGKTASK